MVPAALSKMPPSAKLVYKVLEWNGELTQRQIAEESMLPQRTVRHALTKLENEDLIDKRLSFRDARQRLYSLPEADADQKIAAV